MKNKSFTILLIMGIVSLFLITANCGKSEQKTDNKAAMDAANQVLEALNKIPFGVTTTVDPANISAEAKGDRFLVTFKNPAVTFDTSAYKSFSFGDQFKEMKIPMSFEELTYLYGPKDNYLEIVSATGFTFEMDMSKMIKLPEGTEELPADFTMKLKMEMGKMTFKGYNISAMLKYQGQDLLELLALFLKDNQSLESSVENFKYDIGFTTKDKKNMSILMEAEKIEGIQKSISDLILLLYKKDAESPDFNKALEEGNPIFDLSAKCTNLKISVKEEGNELGGGSLGNISFAYYLKPNDEKTAFNFGSVCDLKNLSLNIPGKKEIEQMGNIQEMGMKFALENISSEFGKAYFDLIKKSMEMRHSADKEQLQQQQAAMGMQIMGAFMQSKPVIKVSLSPFKHHFGELSAVAQFQVIGMMAPVGKAEVKVMKVNDILSKLKEENILPPEAAAGMEQTIKQFLIIDDNGDGSLTFETKADQPGKYFVNGKEMGQ